MRMKRAIAVLSACLVGVPLMASAATSFHVELTIAKTQKRIYAYGTVTPQRDRRVRVRFFHNDDTGYVLSATKWDALDSNGRYEVSFERPPAGTCKVQARFRTATGKVFIDEDVFECRIPDFSTGTATITGANGTQTYDIEIADDGAEQGYGLMYRRWMPDDHGMAFLFDSDTSGSFYMKNTLLPLTIAFFDSAGQIVRVLDMEPCEADDDSGESCPLYSPEATYRGALEVKQGTFEGQEGDVLTYTRD